MQPVTSTIDRVTQRTAGNLGAVALVAVGAVCGLAWATGLRGFMAQIAGPGSGVAWVGTFGWIRAPGVATISATAADISSDVANITVVRNLDTWYRLEGATGGVIADAGIRNNVGGLNGSYSIGSGVRGNALSLAGGAHASLPAGIVNNLNDFTIATWMRVTSLANWARIFDFGSESNGVEDMQGLGERYLFLSPRAVNSMGTLRVAYSSAGSGSEIVVRYSAGRSAVPFAQALCSAWMVLTLPGSLIRMLAEWRGQAPPRARNGAGCP